MHSDVSINSDAMSLPRKLNFITGNENKLAEVRAIIGNGIELESRAIDVPEIQGTSDEIAREKSRRAAEVVGTRGSPDRASC